MFPGKVLAKAEEFILAVRGRFHPEHEAIFMDTLKHLAAAIDLALEKIEGLEGDKSSLQAQIDTLTSEKDDLERKVEAAVDETSVGEQIARIEAVTGAVPDDAAPSGSDTVSSGADTAPSGSAL